uniref:Uncharacterized protein n=1 Tax=Fagus sylvatica TaxID=28930 RepID=A0A2N9GR73_FAGSY
MKTHAKPKTHGSTTTPRPKPKPKATVNPRPTAPPTVNPKATRKSQARDGERAHRREMETKTQAKSHRHTAPPTVNPYFAENPNPNTLTSIILYRRKRNGINNV